MEKIEVGKWNKLPHYSVVGHPQNFYIYINIDGEAKSSDWIKGREAFRLYYDLLKIKNKKVLAENIEKIYSTHKK